eukprot:2079190-Alexandrium_andersonii.AAC.1
MQRGLRIYVPTAAPGVPPRLPALTRVELDSPERSGRSAALASTPRNRSPPEDKHTNINDDRSPVGEQACVVVQR